jgi:hypothetical protein
MCVPAVRVCLPDLNPCIAHRISFHVRGTAAQLHDLAGGPLTMSAHDRRVGVSVARFYTGIERAGYQVGRLSQTGVLVIRKQCGDARECESARRK